MGILVITVDLQCCRCRTKIKNVLECLREDYCIEKIEFEDKANKVIVRGKFDAEKLCKKIWCKACNAVKAIIIVDVWPPPPQKTCPTKQPKTCPTKTRPPDPEPPKQTYKFMPYPYPVPYPIPMQCSWNCPPQQCRCCPATKPPPLPPEPKPSECSQSHHHGGCGCGCGCKPATPAPCYCSNQGGCSCRNYSNWPPPTWWPPQQPFFPPPWSTDCFDL
ncbi:uncharacterized protein [Lolium perenne]|uniref:uncharacterized protein n=1 Tax=Lolium perenne TaxID=4522 RepID=UPI0021EA3897|nr:protein PYRICULARIA ORYZAE RESISTANCE 21-like [Lolium perenne]